MEARFSRAPLLAALLLAALGSLSAPALAASYRTQNFICEAPTAEMARRFCEAAERYRRDLALEWLGYELPPWSSPCPITSEVGPNLGAGGATSFIFQNGNVHGWRMSVQGSEERILDSVLPHEVMHTVFASHFRQPLPRWADEGACTTVEHSSEQARHHRLLVTFLQSNRGIPFDRMFAMREYPKDILPLYAQGHSVVQFLLAQGDKRRFLKFVGDGMVDENWTRAVREHYGYSDLGNLQETWVEWVRNGSPRQVQSPSQLAQARQQPPAVPEAVAAAPRPEVQPVGYQPNPPGGPQAAVQPPPEREASILPWREAEPVGNHTAGNTPPRPKGGSPATSIYQAVRPQPMTPVRQTILE